MNRIKPELLLLLPVLALLLPSCAKEGHAGGDTGANGEITARISLRMPSAAPRTYAISEIDENFVREIDVLAFEADAGKPSGWAFAYSAKGTAITDVTDHNPAGAKKQFSAKLVKGPAQQTFAILANVRPQLEALGAIAAGTDKDELLARLVYSNPGSWNANNALGEDDPGKDFEPFPMWGEAKETLTDATTQITGIYMLRAIARFDVVLSRDVIDAGNFTLDEIYVYNSKNAGRIVPAPANLESPAKVRAATEPGGMINNESPLVYDVPASMNTAFLRTMYLFEARGRDENQSSLATCVVVGGTFGTDGATTYYRLDFLKKADTDTYFRDILRNHLYRMNIVSVSGSGYETPEQAFNSRSVNMIAEIVEWDDGGMGSIVFDGQHILSVSQSEFSFSREEKTGEEYDNVLHVFTDYAATSGASGWHVEKIVDAADGTTPVTWLTTTPDNGAANNRTKVILAFGNNDSGAVRSAIIWIAAGRLRYPVTVVQKLTPQIGINIVSPEDGVPLGELIFFAPVDVVPQAQSFRVNWHPRTADVAISNFPLASPPFPTGAGAPATGTITGGNGGTGTITYDVQPPAITADDLALNPFFERGSKIDFTVGNGLSYESKSIFVRQIFYNLTADKEDSYLLDGSTCTLKVRSNTSWRIKSIGNDAPGTILAPRAGDNLAVGTTGGYNISAGDELTFTVANDKTFWGLLHVTFESTQTPKHFEDKTVTLMFALPRVKITGMAYNSPSGYGYSPTDGGANLNHSAYQMLNSRNNFGLDASSSTVYSRGFDMINKNYTGSISNTDIQSAIAENPDIISIGYDLYINELQAGYYRQYMENGGVIILLCEGNAYGVRNLLREVFGDNSIDQARIHGSGAIYSLPDTDDPILNGPFGDLRGMQWGEDASQTCAVSNLPASDDLFIYSNGNNISNGNNNSRITALRYKNLVWIGDGGFLSANDKNSNLICPFKLDADRRPTIKPDYGASTRYPVYNSQLYANIMTWAITRTGTGY